MSGERPLRVRLYIVYKVRDIITLDFNIILFFPLAISSPRVRLYIVYKVRDIITLDFNIILFFPLAISSGIGN